jgi:tetratricopeptide (TPR) repeat protein
VIEGFAAALRDLDDVETAKQYARKAAADQAIPAAAAAGIVLACADLILPSAPEEARALIDLVSGNAPPEPYAGEARLLLGKYARFRADWGGSLDILGSLEGSRSDDIGARAGLEKARTLEAMGRTAEAVEEYTRIASLFPDLGDRAAEGMANAVRLSRARGETDRASRIEQALRKAYPSSPWLDTLPRD